MKILVTGGAGFIGSHIADAYLNAGHDVFIIDNLSTGRRKNVNERALFYEMDIRDKAVADLFAEQKFDIVNHHAAQMDVRLSVKDPIYDAENNVIGFLNIVQNAAVNKVNKVIYASSGGVIYGEQDYFPADEDHPQRPYCPYGVTKLIGEKYLFYYAVTFGLKYTAFRYANIYGPRQNPHGEAGVIAIFLQKLFRGEQPVINGDGRQTRDYVYIDDVVNANVLALSKGDGEVYNIGTGVETDVNQIYDVLNERTRANRPPQHAPAKSGEQQRSVLAIRKAASQLGWQPLVPFALGIDKTVAYFEQNELQEGGAKS
ncbi:NAD-dependent epimerase/dehydratase family protein [candidate division KSB1 bacterium]|nr:NAD-dependent epimerase/dehydratase family protein [candidate division KSB1 bacterium]RQW07261.1 MAG: NAD-dependent epimerase/dehydratase family protein [candidate division KSB1 bacterium]